MTNKIKTRNALFTSIISLLLCVSMLVGTTFAWFTDEVTSGTNTITAGNLDVELYHGKTSNPTAKVNQDTKLFTDTKDVEIELWEPGVVAYTNLKVANEGNLALKYQMALTFTNANTVGGKSLADVLKVSLIPGGVQGSTREAVLAEAQRGTAGSLQDFKKSGTLEKNVDSDVFGLVVYWPDNNSNEFDNQFNLNNGKLADDQSATLKIDLGVTLFATQLQYEEDSFGSDYDENIWQDAMFVASEEDLVSAIAAGKTAIMLEDNIALSETLVIPEGATVALNLNGKTLSSATGTVIRNEGTLTLGGSGTVESAGQAYAIRVQKGKVTIDSADINVKGAFGAVSIFNGADVTINGGNFNAEGVVGKTSHCIYLGGYGTLNINGGSFNRAAGGDSGSVITGYGWENDGNEKAVININGGTINSETQWGWISNYDGAWTTITATGGTFGRDPAAIVADGYKAVDNGNGTWTVLKGEAAVKNSEELVAAIQAGKEEIALAAGNYVMPDSWTGAHDTYNQNGYDDGLTGVSLQNKSLTLNGSGNVVIDAKGIDSRDQGFTGANLTFNGVTVNFGTALYMGFMNTASLTYNDCDVNGLQFFGTCDAVAFKDCDLNSNGAEHCVWTWSGDKTISFTGCDFTYGDRAVNCYGENGTTNISFTNWTFTKVAGKESTGAIETNSSAMTALNLTISNCTVNEGDLWWVSTYDSLNGAKTFVTVNGKSVAATAEQLRAIAASANGDVEISLTADITLGDDTTQKDMGAYFPNATNVTIDGNGKTLTLKGQMPGNDWSDEHYSAIVAPSAAVTVKNVTIVNEKLGKDGSNCSADRASVYTFTTGAQVLYENVTFIGGVQAQSNTKFVGCSFTEDVLVADSEGYAKNGRFCIFFDHQYTESGSYEFTLEDCTFNASGYGCVKVAGDNGAIITLNVKDCSFNNTCPSNSWSKTTPKYDIKITPKSGVENITVNDLGGNTWSTGTNAGIGKG